MKQIILKKIVPVIASIILISSCDQETTTLNGFDFLPLYTGQDINIPQIDIVRMVTVIDRLIWIEYKLDIEDKIRILADTVSNSYFNGLKIEVLNIDIKDNRRVLHLNLAEREDFSGPGSVPLSESWYDFFQGSAGGQNTSIILSETFLQRNYKGDWIDAVIFHYQGIKMEPMDHVTLSGEISRYR